MNTPTHSILLVDDDEVFRKRLAKAFISRGFNVTEADGKCRALGRIQESTYDYAVIDLALPDGSGLEIVQMLSRQSPDTKCLVLTGYGTISTSVEAIKMGAVHYLTKPAHADKILEALNDRTSPPINNYEDPTALNASAEIPSLSQIEWEHINRVLDDCDGNVSKAAKLLGIHRRSLLRKLSKSPGKLA